jgi:hypothetical protein
MSVDRGLAELASATAWQRANGNTDRPCQDCGVLDIAMFTKVVVIERRVDRVVERVLCRRCTLRQIAEG